LNINDQQLENNSSVVTSIIKSTMGNDANKFNRFHCIFL